MNRDLYYITQMFSADTFKGMFTKTFEFFKKLIGVLK